MADLPPNIALVHDWLTGMRGGEKCLEVFCELYPQAPIHTLVAWPERVSAVIRAHTIRSSFLQRLPLVETRYRHYLPLFPLAVERLNLRGNDLVISSSHAVAKGARPDPGALHVCYIHTPMRYVWDMFDTYFPRDRMPAAQYAFIRAVARRLRDWDRRTSARVHHFVANSRHVAARVRRAYSRDAAVIHPPVDAARFPLSTDDEGYYLVLSALVPYKRVDLAIMAFNELGLPLRVVGDGPDLQALRALARENVRVEGRASDEEVARAYAGCHALVFPGEEDFGIVPVEAMAAGKPVIAYGRGGALETVVDGLTGTFFAEQTVAALVDAVRRLERVRLDPAAIRAHALRFDRPVFRDAFDAFVRERWNDWQRTR